jgi:hypothetical protein
MYLYDLGAELIKEAENCLDPALLELADEWAMASPGYRRKILRALYDGLSLTSRNELVNARSNRLLGEGIETGLKAAFMVLPACFGTYSDSVLRPNCLGMSMMLAAWCKRANATYIFCNTVQDRDSTMRRIWKGVFENTLKWCRSYNIAIPPNKESIMNEDLEILDSTDGTAYASHHCVMVQIQPDDWIVVDPFLGVLGPPNQLAWQPELALDQVYKQLEAHRFTTPGLVTTLELESYDACKLRTTNGLRAAMVDSAVLAKIVKEAEGSVDELLGLLYNSLRSGFLGYSSDHTSNSAMSYYMADWSFDRERTDLAYWGLNVLMTAAGFDGERDYDRYRRDPYFARRSEEKLIFLPIEREISRIDELGRGPLTVGHFSVEASIAELQIGTMVLNHLAVWDPEFTAMVDPAELVLHTGSQLAWHDAVARTYAEKGEDCDDSVALSLIELLTQQPDDVLHYLNRTLLSHQGESEDASDGTEQSEGSRGDPQAA